MHRKDLDLAVQEGHGHVELAKRYTTRHRCRSGQAIQRECYPLLAEARGVSLADVGAITFRPFYTPASFGRPARLPLLTSVFFFHSCSVAGEQPIFATIDETAAHRDECSAS